MCIHMPHPSPSLHLATTEIAGNEGMFSGLMATISKGVAFATGESPAPSQTVVKIDPCSDKMAALHRCLKDESADCTQAFDDLIRCRYAFLPSPNMSSNPRMPFTR